MKQLTKLASLLFIATFAMYSCINDADVAAPDITSPNETGNLALTFEIPNSSNTRSAESSGSTETGSESEYKINELTIYLFDAVTKIFVEQQTLTNFTFATTSGSAVKYNSKRITVKPGVYNIFAIANGKTAATDFSTQEKFLASIDKTTYNQGKIVSVPTEGFMMSNRGAANQNVKVDEPTNFNYITNISISLERVVAKIELTQTQESFPLKDDKGNVYCTIKLSNFRIMNLATQFYTFRHTAVLTDFQEPSAYTDVNFDKINDNNGYLIDPYFFKKSPNEEDAKNFTNADGYFVEALVDKNSSNYHWEAMTNANNWSRIYCLENSMYVTAQRNAYTTGVMFRATMDIAADHIFDEKGQIASNPDKYQGLYYCGKNFFTSTDAIKFKYDIPGHINDQSTAEELAKYHIKYFARTANYSCYYNYWIKHLDNNSPEMGVMEFGIVRNNIYRLSVTKISDIGTGEPSIKPEQPDENDAILDIDFDVFPWVIRNQDVELD